MHTWTLIAYAVACYALGGILTGHWIARLKDGGDLSRLGSGSAGARNAGRMYGKTAFALTFLGDAVKGWLAVSAALWIEPSYTYGAFVLAAVVLGHIYSPLHKLRGGKGMSALCGGTLALHAGIWLGMIALALLILLIFRSFTVAGLTGITAFPALAVLLHMGAWTLLTAVLIVILIGYVHRDNIARILQNRS